MPIKSGNGQVLVNPAEALAPAAPVTPDIAIPEAPDEPSADLGASEWGMIESSGDADAMPPAPPPADQRPDRLPLPAQAAAVVVPPASKVPSDCPEGHENPPAAKFCNECGIRLETIPRWSCGHQNPDQAKFCNECGQPAFRAPVVGAGIAVELAARVQNTADLTPAQRQEREVAHAAALRNGAQLPRQLQFVPARTSNTETIHFLEDGFTFAANVWMRGQEITLDVGSQRWQEAQAWWNMPEFDQVDRYGKIMFRHGPWPGKRYTDVRPEQFVQLGHPDKTLAEKGVKVHGPSLQDLELAQQAELRRRGAVPAPSLS